jgi:hypothetical protein
MFIKHVNRLKRVRQEGETAPFKTPRTVITYLTGAITLQSDGIQLEYWAVIGIDTAICLKSCHVRRTAIHARHVH